MSGHGQGPSTSKSPSGSGSQNPRSHLSSDPRWRQGASNPARSANATGNTDTSHPSSSTGIGSLPPRPTTVAKELSPRTAKPNYGYYRDSTLSSSMHIPPRQAIPGPTPNNAPLKVTATKTSSKPSLASKSAGSTRADDGTSGGGGGIGGTESLSQATPSRPRFQPPKVAGRPGDARVSPASGRIVSMDSISRAGLATTSNAVASKSMARHAPRVCFEYKESRQWICKNYNVVYVRIQIQQIDRECTNLAGDAPSS
ncbi:hypothetical protein M413DRAFT_128840 [Hebeloma cylindrosporum]|uniref:Uncharacterized protein n=1 Tax=Hebeloma cylindrosporum TaxID=76867 RepID=A0A0C2XX18_HEBCY|nr:hypothetical protein M413DRAFT_128840 [Hebeloma cylindrosporum h7]